MWGNGITLWRGREKRVIYMGDGRIKKTEAHAQIYIYDMASERAIASEHASH